jgi:hypothetical protein
MNGVRPPTFGRERANTRRISSTDRSALTILQTQRKNLLNPVLLTP